MPPNHKGGENIITDRQNNNTRRFAYFKRLFIFVFEKYFLKKLLFLYFFDILYQK